MDGSGIAGLIAVIMVGGIFGLFLPGHMLVFAIQDGNYPMMAVFIIWLAISITIIVAIVRWILKDPRRRRTR